MLDYATETNWVQEWVRGIIAERENVFTTCRTLAGNKYAVYPSQGNFLLFQGPSDRAHNGLIKACDSYHIRVENMHAKPRLERCIRVTIGLPQENQLFLQAFGEAMQKL
jgi:histidinol-phosphate aminotransferase